MKKELNLKINLLTISFFFDDQKLKGAELKRIKHFLSLATEAFSLFLKKEKYTKDIKSFYLNINLCSDYKIKALNKNFRGKNKKTDVLSFPLQENIRALIFDSFHGELELGDLFICESVCRKQALEFNLTFFEEFIHLLTHGFLHLLGFDHEISRSEEKLMESLEEKIIKKISKLNERESSLL